MIYIPFRYSHEPEKFIHKVECSIYISGYSRPRFSTNIDVPILNYKYILVEDLIHENDYDTFDYISMYNNMFKSFIGSEDRTIDLPLYIEFKDKKEFLMWKLKR